MSDIMATFAASMSPQGSVYPPVTPVSYPGGFQPIPAPPHAAYPMPPATQAPPQGGYYYVPAPQQHVIPAPGGGSYVYMPPAPAPAPAPLAVPMHNGQTLRVGGGAPMHSAYGGVPGALPSAVLKMQAGKMQAGYAAPSLDQNATNMMPVDQGIREKATQLRVQHIERNVTPTQFAELFDPFGLVNLVRIVKHKDTQASRGYGFVYFDTHEAALAAIEAAQKKSFVLNGQALEVGFADPQRPLSRRALAHVAFRMRKKQQLEDEAAAAEGTPRSGSVTGSDGMPRMITDATEFRTTSPSSASATAAGSGHGSDSEEQEELSRRLRETFAVGSVSTQASVKHGDAEWAEATMLDKAVMLPGIDQ